MSATGNTISQFVVTTDEARRLINAGEEVFAVYERRGSLPVLFSDEEAAWVFAERHDVRVLDYATGDYA